MVYNLGSETDASLTASWSEASPVFHVSEPRECELVVRQHLPFSSVRYIGAHTGCGCGFRRSHAGYIDADPDDADENAAAQADHEALVAYLRAMPIQPRPMQIYGCWSGDESLPPEHFRTCAISQLVSSDFGFQERELITLVT
jgi:hypothetical protein